MMCVSSAAEFMYHLLPAEPITLARMNEKRCDANVLCNYPSYLQCVCYQSLCLWPQRLQLVPSYPHILPISIKRRFSGVRALEAP